MDKLWVLEFRCRNRKNGPWSDWESMDNVDRGVVTAYREYPDHMILQQEKYERRAVEYRRNLEGQ